MSMPKSLRHSDNFYVATYTLGELVAQDLSLGVNPDTGRPGMTGEQVLRAALIRQMHGYSYDTLAFHLADSLSFQRFCGIGIGDEPPSKSTLQRNIKRIRPDTWEELNRRLVRSAVQGGVESGRTVRVDCTVVESNIHHPTDSSLLFDVVRVLARLMSKVRARHAPQLSFSNRTLRAKRRMLGILRVKKKTQRHDHYRDLVKVTVETLEFVSSGLPGLRDLVSKLDATESINLAQAVSQLEHFSALGWQVVDQTFRRVLQGQSVPAAEKIVSIFEKHTDIIVKDRRETLYGHKVCLSTGPSSLVLDCVVLDGNPADATLVDTMLDRHIDLLNKPPRQAAFDGGFASKDNVTLAKAKGVSDVCFHKKRGIKISEMVRSDWVFKKLRRFRAGVEGCISWLKRSFGMRRSRWSGAESFKSYVWASIVTCNLLIFV